MPSVSTGSATSFSSAFAQTTLSSDGYRPDQDEFHRTESYSSQSPPSHHSVERRVNNMSQYSSRRPRPESSAMVMSRTPSPARQRMDPRMVPQQRSDWQQSAQWSMTPRSGTREWNGASYNTTANRLTGTLGNCGYCGRQHPFGKQFCKAATVQCFNCSKVGHLAKMCRSNVIKCT